MRRWKVIYTTNGNNRLRMTVSAQSLNHAYEVAHERIYRKYYDGFDFVDIRPIS